MAGILRRETVSSTPAFSFPDLESDARAIIDQARRQAVDILAKAESEARQRGVRIEREAHARGAETGRREGTEQARVEALETARRDARDELNSLSRTLREALAEFEDNKRRLLAQAECGVIDLALSIARRVCKHDVGASSESALANARAVLEMARHERDPELRMNPADRDLLGDALPEVIAAVEGLEHVGIVADGEIDRGGCVLCTRAGTIDASIETQLDRVAQALVKA